MNNNILNNKKKSKVISYMLIMLSFLFIIIVTKSMYYDLQIAEDSLSQASISLSNKNRDLDKMNKLKVSFASNQDIAKTINKFTINLSEQDLIEYFYSYAYKVNSGISINNISMEKGTKNEMGFLQSNINLSLTFKDEISMQKFIDLLTNPSSKYSFILQNFAYPFGENNKDFQVNIPLKMLYY